MADKRQDPMPAKDEQSLLLAARLRQVPRCGARTRVGGVCSQPAMDNKRCRMHGGLSTGPRTAEGLERLVQARTVHGGYGAEMRSFRKEMRDLREDARRMRVELIK